MRKLFLTLSLLGLGLSAVAQPENSDDRMSCYRMMPSVRKIVSIPDIDGYHTFKCDLHLHTVFADAQVSPQGRVQEAWYDGLDIIAMSEHVGVHKSKGIHLEDQNLPYELAAAEGAKYGMMVIHAVEITRAKPFGHMNGLFVTDCNAISQNRYLTGPDGKNLKDSEGRALNNEETLKSDVEAVLAQGGILMWNHPGWPDKKCDMYPVHKEMIEKGLISCVEICNNLEWYPKVLDWFDEYKLPMAANSDIHRPTSIEYGHVLRPMTLVFAKEYTQESVKEAIKAGRMVAFWDQTLAGDGQYLRQLVHNSLSVKVVNAKTNRIEVTNNSDIRFETLYGDHMNPVVIYPHSAILMTVAPGQEIEFVNCYKGRAHLTCNLW